MKNKTIFLCAVFFSISFFVANAHSRPVLEKVKTTPYQALYDEYIRYQAMSDLPAGKLDFQRLVLTSNIVLHDFIRRGMLDKRVESDDIKSDIAGLIDDLYKNDDEVYLRKTAWLMIYEQYAKAMEFDLSADAIIDKGLLVNPLVIDEIMQIKTEDGGGAAGGGGSSGGSQGGGFGGSASGGDCGRGSEKDFGKAGGGSPIGTPMEPGGSWGRDGKPRGKSGGGGSKWSKNGPCGNMDPNVAGGGLVSTPSDDPWDDEMGKMEGMGDDSEGGDGDSWDNPNPSRKTAGTIEYSEGRLSDEEWAGYKKKIEDARKTGKGGLAPKKPKKTGGSKKMNPESDGGGNWYDCFDGGGFNISLGLDCAGTGGPCGPGSNDGMGGAANQDWTKNYSQDSQMGACGAALMPMMTTKEKLWDPNPLDKPANMMMKGDIEHQNIKNEGMEMKEMKNLDMPEKAGTKIEPRNKP